MKTKSNNKKKDKKKKSVIEAELMRILKKGLKSVLD